jgi:hypothetical protein
MNDAKYIGLDVHQATISAAVLDSTGKLVMESILETKAATVLQFFHGLRERLYVTFEEGTCAAWLHDLLKPHVTQVLVRDPPVAVTAIFTGQGNNRSCQRIFVRPLDRQVALCSTPLIHQSASMPLREFMLLPRMLHRTATSFRA